MTDIIFPDVGEGIVDGELVKWLVAVGDTVKADQPVAEIETDKAIVEIPSSKGGTVSALHGSPGETIKVGSVLVTLDDTAAAPAQQTKNQAASKKAVPKKSTPEKTQPAASSADPQTSTVPPAQSSPSPAAPDQDAGTVMGVIPEYHAPDNAFHLGNGVSVDTLTGLATALRAEPALFEKHVGTDRNDFADWIRHVFKDTALAEHVRTAETNDALLAILSPRKKRNGVLAMPGVRAAAEKKNIDLHSIKPSGRQGQITMDDLKKAKTQTATPSETDTPESSSEASGIKVKKREYDLYGYIDRVPMKGVRKAVATHMLEACQKTAPVTHFEDVDATNLIALRSEAKKKYAEQVNVTYLPFIIKAIIATLKNYPILNANFDEQTNEIIVKKYYNISIAVDTPAGLIVPVIKIAERKSLLDLANEVARLAEGARTRKLDLAELKGGTFTITSVGPKGSKYETPIINYPEVAILYLGSIRPEAVVIDGVIQARSILPLALTFDHRIIDGAEAARFLFDLKKLLEQPSLLLLD